MSNLKSEEDKTVYQFSEFSEATAKNGVSLAPILAKKWEEKGESSLYTHIAKGGVSIDYFFTREMADEYARRIEEYNRDNSTAYLLEIDSNHQMDGAADYFFEKIRDFFTDTEIKFPDDDLSNKCFFWIQGESDANSSVTEYEIKLDVVWDYLKRIGFTHFFVIRIGYFGANIHRIMEAQERFAQKHSDAFMLTRVMSFFRYSGHDDEKWFATAPDEECECCRDSFYGFDNQHINEKGFFVIAEHGVENLYRVLRLGKEPMLEEEIVSALIKER